MKPSLYCAVLCLLAAGLPATPLAAADHDLNGAWKLVVEVGGQSREYALELKQEGEKVSGVLVSPRSGRYPFHGGAFRAGELEITVPRPRENATQRFKVTARLRADGTLAGTLAIDGRAAGEVKLARRGPSPLGKWLAVAKSPDGGQEYPSTVEIAAGAGHELKGRNDGQLGVHELRAVKLEGDRLSFELVLPIDGNDVPFIIRARFEGEDRLVGRWQIRERDELAGEWTARRAPAERAAPPRAAEPKESPSPEPGASPLAGRWYARSRTPEGEQVEFQLELEVSGAHVSGKAHTPQGTLQLRDGKVQGRQAIELKITVELDGERREVRLKGELKGKERLQGTWRIGHGDEIEWSAEKPVEL
jgi:hypothetical protein